MLVDIDWTGEAKLYIRTWVLTEGAVLLPTGEMPGPHDVLFCFGTTASLRKFSVVIN